MWLSIYFAGLNTCTFLFGLPSLPSPQAVRCLFFTYLRQLQKNADLTVVDRISYCIDGKARKKTKPKPYTHNRTTPDKSTLTISYKVWHLCFYVKEFQHYMRLGRRLGKIFPSQLFASLQFWRSQCISYKKEVRLLSCLLSTFAYRGNNVKLQMSSWLQDCESKVYGRGRGKVVPCRSKLTHEGPIGKWEAKPSQPQPIGKKNTTWNKKLRLMGALKGYIGVMASWSSWTNEGRVPDACHGRSIV